MALSRVHSCVGQLWTRKVSQSLTLFVDLLWGGVHIFTDHRNLAYIFNPEACVTSVTKAMAQRLENWKAVLGQYRYAIEHIPGERNCWGDLLSRWVKVPSVPVRSVAVHSPCDADDSLPSVDVIRAAQRKCYKA